MIAIIGGGIIGTAIAYYLAQAGIKDVCLIEKEKLLGTGVTQFCSGGVRSQFTTPINIQFSIEARKELEKFDIGFRKLGYLILDTEQDSKPRVELQNRMEVASEYLTPGEIKKRFPYINIDKVKSASFYAEDGVADPSMLMAIYEKGARAGGVEFRMEHDVKDIRQLKADLVILTAGVGSKELARSLGVEIPIVKRRKYVLIADGFDFDFPLTMEIPLGWYIKKECDDVLLGMSGKVEEIDFEKQQEAMEETIEASLYRFPPVKKSGIKRVISSMSDETPDKHAIIDNSIPGVIIATGFSGHGFMHSPAVGRIVTSLVKGEKPIIDISELKLGRSHIKEPLVI